MKTGRYAFSCDWQCSCFSSLADLRRCIGSQTCAYVFLAHKSVSAAERNNLLSLEEKEREKKLLRRQDRLRFRATHSLKRLVCSLFTDVPPLSLCFEVDKYNKPYLQTGPHSIFFNLSHSGEWGGITLSRNGPVGFDVQAPVDLKDFPASEVVHPHDCIQADNPRAATVIWAIKEAVTKAHGIGLYFPFNKLRIEATTSTSWNVLRLLEETWFVRSGLLADGSAMAVAARSLHEVKSFQFLGGTTRCFSRRELPRNGWKTGQKEKI